MCGILGAVNYNINESHFEKMLNTLAHRGPDEIYNFFSIRKELEKKVILLSLVQIQKLFFMLIKNGE